MLTIENWTTFIDTLLDDYLLLSSSSSNHSKEYIFNARQFLLKTNFYCSLILRELTLHYGQSVGSFHLLQIFIDEYLYYRIEQKISIYLNQTIFNLRIDNLYNQQEEEEKDLFNDEDDLESLTDDFNEQRNQFKPLSPVQIDEFILPNSFSYIFEDLQPLSNEIFSS
jgi:hypothetical protein